MKTITTSNNTISKAIIAFVLLFAVMSSTAQVNRKNTKTSVVYRANYQRMSTSCEAQHSLEIREGKLWAWGWNLYGQLGDGTTSNQTNPEQIGTDTKWVSVSAGGGHSLALKADGTLWAWGNNNNGQLGDGTLINKTSPEQIGIDNKWVSISAGGYHSLALKSDGTLWAWGLNGSGQLGNGNTTNQTSPMQIGTDNKWVNISSGGSYSTSVKSDGTLWAWGNNGEGELGDGTTTNRLNPLKIGTDTKWVNVSAGLNHTLGLKGDGTLWAWGDNSLGELGDGTTVNESSPEQIGTDTKWVTIAAGYFHSHSLKADGTHWAWGWNANGQLGDGTTTNKTSPEQIGTDTKWVSIVAGYYHCLGLKADGSFWAWGANSLGQLGTGNNTNNQISPIQTSVSLSIWLTIAEGGNHSLAIKTDGTLWVWGQNTYGQVGDGTNIERKSPVQIGTDNKWISVAGGQYYCLALKADGTLWAWGRNDYGQLGDGTTGSENSPEQIGTDTKWVSIAAGYAHSIALKADGTLWAWGRNDYGQVGDGSGTERNSPVQIGTDTKWASITAGAYHSLSIKADGTLWGWGQNNSFQLGDGTGTNQLSPEELGTDTKWISIAAGGEDSHALKSDGTLWAFGYNSFGQLGDGTVNYHNTQEQIGTDTKWISIAEGYYHGISLKSDGTLWAWGYNGDGQLGDGTNNEDNNPEQIGTENNWVKITGVGTYFTLGLKSERIEYCATGDNSSGQLGYCNTTNQANFICIGLTPVVVTPPANAAVCVGNTVVLSVTANYGVNYQWQQSTDNGNTWISISDDGLIYNGSSTSSLTLAPTLGMNGYYFHVVISGSTSCTPSATSSYGILTVNNFALPNITVSAIPSDSICTGQDVTLSGNGAISYLWTNGITNGTAFIPSGTTTYTVTGTNANGCYNSTFTTVTVNPLPTVSSTVIPLSGMICNGQNVTLSGTGANTYSWTGSITNGVVFSPSTTATYTVTGTDGHGCQNTATQTITVHPLPNVTASASPLSTFCFGNSVTLTGGGANAYSWSGGITNGISFSPAATATYTVTGTDGNNCQNTATQIITVNPIPTIIGTTPNSVCGTGTVTLAASASTGTINWYAASTGGTSLGTGTSFTTPTIAATTTYYIDATAAGCTTAARTSIVATVNPIPTISSTTPNSICGAGMVTLGAIASAGTINWYASSSGGTSLGIGNSFATPTIFTNTYYYVDAALNGCTTTFRTAVLATIDSLPLTAVNSPSICFGHTANLIATGATTYTWSTGATSVGGGTATANPAFTASYTVTGTIGTCSSTALATVTVNQLPIVTANALPASAFCKGNSVTLSGGGAVSYTWTGGVIDGTSFTPNSTATYTVTGTDAHSCQNTNSITITVNALPTANITSLPATCTPNGSVTAAPTSGASPFTYLWSNNDTSQTVSGLNVATYSVTVTDNNGCRVTGSATVSNVTLPAPSICEVTVDSTTGSNQYIDIYWDKTGFGSNIDSVIAYRYSPTLGSYLRIGSVPNNASTLSRLTDTARSVDGPHGGDPDYTYYQYKLAVHDTCGNTSAMSLYHLSCNFFYVSGNLFQWNEYTIENSQPIQGYNLMKDSLSNGVWHVVTPAVGMTASDPYYSSSDSASYRVDALGFNCAATRASISTTHSNIKHNALAIGINQLAMDNVIRIYPNPANETVTIDVSSSKFKVSSLKVYNVMGEVVYQSVIVNPKTLIDISNFAKGIYTIEVGNEAGNVFKKLVVQ